MLGERIDLPAAPLIGRLEDIAAALAGAQVGDLSTAKAHWVAADTIAWNVPAEVAIYKLYYSPDAALKIQDGKVVGGESLSLRVDKAGLSEDILARFPQLAGFTAFKIKEEDLSKVPEILKGQFAVSVSGSGGKIKDATGLQIPGVLDDLYTYDGPLGIIYDGDTPTLKLWAPTAKSVKLHLFDNPKPETEATVLAMALDPATGVWSITGEPDWTYKFFLYEVDRVRADDRQDRNQSRHRSLFAQPVHQQRAQPDRGPVQRCQPDAVRLGRRWKNPRWPRRKTSCCTNCMCAISACVTKPCRKTSGVRSWPSPCRSPTG